MGEGAITMGDHDGRSRWAITKGDHEGRSRWAITMGDHEGKVTLALAGCSGKQPTASRRASMRGAVGPFADDCCRRATRPQGAIRRRNSQNRIAAATAEHLHCTGGRGKPPKSASHFAQLTRRVRPVRVAFRSSFGRWILDFWKWKFGILF